MCRFSIRASFAVKPNPAYLAVEIVQSFDRATYSSVAYDAQISQLDSWCGTRWSCGRPVRRRRLIGYKFIPANQEAVGATFMPIAFDAPQAVITIALRG